MPLLASLLTGGFLKGYRTYLLGIALALSGLARYLAGDATLAQLLDSLPEILGGLGLASLRAAVQTILPAVEVVLTKVATSGRQDSPPRSPTH
jgi:hypothetical protein